MILLQNQEFFIYYIDCWKGLYYADLKLLYSSSNADRQSIQGFYFGLGSANISPTTVCMILSNKQIYLFLGVRSQGVLIYDITNRTKPVLYYQLFVDAQAFTLLLSNDEQILYFSNSNGVYKYKITQLQLGNSIPNLFNYHKSKSLLDGGSFYKWRCQISKNNNVLYSAFDINQLQRFFLKENDLIEGSMRLQQIDIIPYESDNFQNTAYIDSVLIDSDEKYLYVPITSDEYAVIKYEIPQTENIFAPLKAKQFLKVNNMQYSETMRLSQDNKYIIMAYSVGILIVDNEKFETIRLFEIHDIKHNCYGADFTRDSNYVFATGRNVGIWIIDVIDKKNPVVKQVLRTRGGESVRTSHLFDIMYAMDGFNGLIIFDTSALPDIQILSQIKLQGWVNDITLINNENYGIVSTMDRGMIWLINLINKQNPFLVSSYQIDQQNAQSTCIDPLMRYLIILNSQSVRYFPLVSSVLIHFECSLKQNNNKKDSSRIILGENDYLEVGQTYELRLIPLYRKKYQQISQVYLYWNYKKLELPSWIDHMAEQYLEMTIPKEVLTSSANFTNSNLFISKEQGENYDNSQITLLVKTSFSIQEDSFIFNTTSFTTSKELSKKIFLFLKTNSFLDNQDLLTDLFNPEIKLEFSDFGDEVTDTELQSDIMQSVRDLLQNSIDYNPISFKVKSSLSCIFNKNINIFQVQSISNYVSIQFSFNLNQSLIFVQKNYPNVITFRNEQDTTLKFDSSIDIINNILKQNIIYHYHNSTQNKSQIYTNPYSNQISIVISDGLNSDLQQQFNISDLTFLKLKSEIQKLKSLQEQVERISSDGDSDFAIEQSLLIQFDDKSFYDPDEISIQYKLLIQQDGQYISIPPQYFLKFDSENIRITGTPTTEVLFQVIHLRLIATNGYTEAQDDFYIKIYKVSLMYVLNQMVRILGPVAFILGIYKQRSYFINAIWKKKTFYSNEFAQVNQIYRKKITLLGNELIITQLFFNKFCSKNLSKTQFYNANQSQNNLESFNQSEKDEQSEFRKNIIFNNILTTQPQQNNQQSSQKICKNTSIEAIDQGIQNLHEKHSKWKRNSYLNNSSKQNQGAIKKRHFSTPTVDIKPILAQFRKNNRAQTNQKNITNSSMSDLKTNNFPLLKKLTYKLNEQEEDRANTARKNLNDAKKKKVPQNDIIQNLCFSNPQFIINMQLFFNQKAFQQDSQENTTIQDVYITGDALFNKMLIDDLDITFKNKKIKISNYTKEYSNKYSRFHYCLKACIINYLLKLDVRTQVVYKYLKSYAKESLNYTKKDWYKAYVTVDPTNEFDSNGLPIPFSKIHLTESNFIPPFSHLQIYGGKQQFYNKIIDHGVNPILLKEALVYASLGLLTNNSKRGFMNKSKGESIHLQQHEILSVEAFKLKQHSRMKCLRKIFNLEYSRMPISKYLSLPSWIQFDCKNGVIMLEGMPTHSDIEEVLIRVYNTSNCIIMQFFLKISDESNLDKTQFEISLSQQINQSTENILDTPLKSINNNLNNSNGTINNLTEKNMFCKRQKRSVFSISPQKQPIQTLPSNISQKSLNFDYDMQQLDSLPPQLLDQQQPSFLEQSMKRSTNQSQLSNLIGINNNSYNNVTNINKRSKKNKFSLFLYQYNRQNSNKDSYCEDIDQSAIINYNIPIQTRKVTKSLTDVSSHLSQSLKNQLSSSSSYFDSQEQSNSFTGENHNLPKQTYLNINANPFVENVSETI